MLVIALIFFYRFRWVFCQLEALRQCLPSSVRCTLADLPESLDETYERILQQIPKSKRVHAHRLLQCLTVAMRPLRVDELAEVLAINFPVPGGTPMVDENLRWEDTERAVLSTCSSLITIVQDEYSRHVQFSHFSVKEFLTSDRLATSVVGTLRYYYIHLESAHTIMAQACLSVLLRLDNSMDRRTIESYPLARYAGQHFGDHVELENVLPHVTKDVDNLLDPDKPHFDTWVWLQTGDWEAHSWHNSRKDEEGRFPFIPPLHFSSIPKYPPRVSPLYYVASFGHLCLAHHLISKRPHDLHAMDDKCCTPLHIAVLAGKVEVSKLLIENPINLDIRDTEDWTLLHMAAYKGLFEVSQILLERHDTVKACLNMRNKKGRTALHLASRHHHSSIVELLLKFGADVKTQDDDNMTALHLALRGPSIYDGRVDDGIISAIVQLLLAHGASVNVRDKKNQTPLHLASLQKYPSTMALLLQSGADTESRDNDYMTPLLFALQEPWDKDEAAQLLLEHGANVNAQNKNGQTALHIASASQLAQIVSLLLKLGLDVNAKDNDDMTPLHLAPMGLRGIPDDDFTRSTTAQVLLEHGANVHIRNKNGQTPLHSASLHRFSSIVELLVKFGADVNAKDNDNMTPLHLISETPWYSLGDDSPGRCNKTAQALLEHRASVHARNKNGQTPLHLASLRRFSSTVELLLKFDAVVDAKDNDNMTPLHLISTKPRGQTEDDIIGGTVAQVLLGHGGSVSTRNKNGQTPLHLASLHRFSSIVAVLLEFDAEVDVRDNDNMTPLLLAAAGEPTFLLHYDDDRCNDTAQLLLSHSANVNVRNKKDQTPLHIASQRYFCRSMKLLLEFGADVDAQDNDNITPLHVAISSSPKSQAQWYISDNDFELHELEDVKVEVIQLLLKHGANIQVQNNEGETLFQLAEARREQKVIQFLYEYMQNDHSISI